MRKRPHQGIQRTRGLWDVGRYPGQVLPATRVSLEQPQREIVRHFDGTVAYSSEKNEYIEMLIEMKL